MGCRVASPLALYTEVVQKVLWTPSIPKAVNSEADGSLAMIKSQDLTSGIFFNSKFCICPCLTLAFCKDVLMGKSPFLSHSFRHRV